METETRGFGGNSEAGEPPAGSLAELEERLRVLKLWAGQGAGTADDRVLVEKLEGQIKEKRKKDLQ